MGRTRKRTRQSRKRRIKTRNTRNTNLLKWLLAQCRMSNGSFKALRRLCKELLKASPKSRPQCVGKDLLKALRENVTKWVLRSHKNSLRAQKDHKSGPEYGVFRKEMRQKKECSSVEETLEMLREIFLGTSPCGIPSYRPAKRPQYNGHELMKILEFARDRGIQIPGLDLSQAIVLAPKLDTWKTLMRQGTHTVSKYDQHGLPLELLAFAMISDKYLGQNDIFVISGANVKVVRKGKCGYHEKDILVIRKTPDGKFVLIEHIEVKRTLTSSAVEKAIQQLSEMLSREGEIKVLFSNTTLIAGTQKYVDAFMKDGCEKQPVDLPVLQNLHDAKTSTIRQTFDAENLRGTVCWTLPHGTTFDLTVSPDCIHTIAIASPKHLNPDDPVQTKSIVDLYRKATTHNEVYGLVHKAIGPIVNPRKFLFKIQELMDRPMSLEKNGLSVSGITLLKV